MDAWGGSSAVRMVDFVRVSRGPVIEVVRRVGHTQMSIFDAIDKLITEHGSATILKERITQLREEFERLQDKYDRLEAEHQKVVDENQRLRKQLEQTTIPDEYTEHRGVLFRRLPNGKLQDEAYCPDCKIPMTSEMGIAPMRCSKCHRTANFTGKQIHRVISELLGSE